MVTGRVSDLSSSNIRIATADSKDRSWRFLEPRALGTYIYGILGYVIDIILFKPRGLF